MLLSLFLSALLPPSLHAWGEAGHRIVAAVAEQHLEKNTVQAIQELSGVIKGNHTQAGGTGLVSLATWADQLRGDRPETGRWHFVDIPSRLSSYHPERDCSFPNEGDCDPLETLGGSHGKRDLLEMVGGRYGNHVIGAIEHFRSILHDRKRPPADRSEALRFLVHFIADLHQPLHTIDTDRGGNDLPISFFGEAVHSVNGEPWNLHAVWDTGLIKATGLSETAYVARLNAWLKRRSIRSLQEGTVIDWALESHRLAKEVAYQIPKDRNLSKGYFEKSLPVVDEMLAKAGVRLATVLNMALR